MHLLPPTRGSILAQSLHRKRVLDDDFWRIPFKDTNIRTRRPLVLHRSTAGPSSRLLSASLHRRRRAPRSSTDTQVSYPRRSGQSNLRDSHQYVVILRLFIGQPTRRTVSNSGGECERGQIMLSPAERCRYVRRYANLPPSPSGRRRRTRNH